MNFPNHSPWLRTIKNIHRPLQNQTPYFFISAVTAVNKEQLTGTIATISCIVSGLTKKLDGVKWKKSDDTDITSGQGGYTTDDGNFNNGSQTTTLTVGPSVNTKDDTYSCLITSIEHGVTEKSTSVNSAVFGKLISQEK